MKTKLILLCIAISCISLNVFGQKKTYFGVEGALNWDVWDATSEGSAFQTTPAISGNWGFTVGQELNNYLRIETGIIRKYYQESYTFNANPIEVTSLSTSLNSWNIPLRLKMNTNIYKQKIYLTTTIGYQYCINSDYGFYDPTPGEEGHFGGGSFDSISWNEVENTNLRHTFSLIEAGIGLEFIVLKKAHVDLSFSYLAGLNKIAESTINYQVNNEPYKNAKMINNGNFYSFGIGISYPISDLWQKEI
ncbi:MAG: outer membrane beta-barrel protein [Bacteroidota bacterium]